MRPYNKQQQKGNTSPHHTHKTLHAQRSKNKPDKIQKRKDYSRPLSSSHTTHPHHTQPPHTVTITCSRARNNNMCHPRHPTMHQRTPTLCVSHTPPTTRYRYPMIMMPHTNNRVPKQAIHPQKQTISAHQPPAGPLRQQKVKLLRKEVIQPHLPVRLPCYDFVPIANPTFDGSLTSLGHRLRVLPTFMT